MKDNSTPLQRLTSACDQLTRAETRHAEKAEELKRARKELERREMEEALAADAVETAKAAVHKAMREYPTG